MFRSRVIAAVFAVSSLAAAAACSRAGAGSSPAPNASGALPPAVTDARLPHTRAELTNYTETSRYTDVVAFIDSLKRLGAPITVGSIGTTSEHRSMPYVIASRPPVSTPEAARALGRPIVYVQGNIHAGEVEG